MSADMARAELWARIALDPDRGLEQGHNPLDTATIDGRPLTPEERASAGAATLADLQAADVLRQARIGGMDAYIAAGEELLRVLRPWWEGRSLEQALVAAPEDVRARAAGLLELMAALDEVDG